MKNLLLVTVLITLQSFAQTDPRIYEIINDISTSQIKKSVTELTRFGKRHSMSDTISTTQGIGHLHHQQK